MAPAKVTYAQYSKLPEEVRAEVLDGELVMSPVPTPYHQEVLSRLVRLFEDFVRARRLGKVYFAPVDVVLTRHKVLQPDLLFIARERLDIIGPKHIAGPPDLVVELHSRDTAVRDRKRKRGLYEKHGVRELWLVDQERKCIDVLVLRGGAYATHAEAENDAPAASVVLDGFAVRPAEIF